MFRFLKKIDYRIHETLNIYEDLGRLSVPFFKYLLMIVSFLIVVSSVSIIISFFTGDSKPLTTDTVWINYSLPIIIYGVITPIISTIITIILKLFLEKQISNIKNKYKYTYKLHGKYPNKYSEFKNIIKFIIKKKDSLVIPASLLIFLLPLDTTISSIFVLTIICFFLMNKISEYYNNDIVCGVNSVEKCYTNNDYFWRYCIYIKYPNEEGRYVKKRFSDFKKLHDKLVFMDELPTEEWISTANDIKDANTRGKYLDNYLHKLIAKKDILSNSVFNSFFSEQPTNNNILVMENEDIIGNQNNGDQNNSDQNNDEQIRESTNINQQSDNISTNDVLLTKIRKMIDEDIEDVYILHEINYYLALKKRFFVITKNNFFKLLYDKFSNKFFIRYKIPLYNIYKVEKSKIINTSYLRNKQIVIIYYGDTGEIKLSNLISITNNIKYNVDSFYNNLKKHLTCQFVSSRGYFIDNGYGITENILHNKYVVNTKNLLNTRLLKFKSFFD